MNTLAIAGTESLATLSEKGNYSFTHATVRAAFRSQGFTGKELSKKVSETMSQHQSALVAGIAGSVQAGGLQVAGVTRNKDGSKITVRYAAPKVDKDKKELVSENGALRAELDEVRKLIAEMRAAQAPKIVAETAPDEPAPVETTMGAAFEAAGV